VGILFQICHYSYFELYARIKFEKTGSRLGVFVVVATLLCIVDDIFVYIPKNSDLKGI